MTKTATILAKEQVVHPEITFERKTRLKYGERVLELAHYDGGHTSDNVVAWVADQKILVGGCLIKSAASSSLGNLKDADIKSYPVTIQSVKKAYPDAMIVTPGHGKTGNLSLIDHTIQLLKKAKLEHSKP